jgi:Spy/CpxP family protein refolding chaperone
MKKTTLAQLATGLVLLTSAGALTAVQAIDTKHTFIDQDFEVAIRKHIERRVYDLIDATDAQREKISQLLSQRQDETRPEREKLREGLADLSQMMAGDANDEAIISKAHELRSMHEQIMDERLNTMLKVRTMLTADQRKILSDKVVAVLSGEWKKR